MPQSRFLPKYAVLLSAILLTTFAVFTLIVRLHFFEALDFNLTVKIQNHVSPVWYTPFSILSVLGSIEVITFFLLATIVHFKHRFIPIAVGYAIGTVIELLGKTVVFHPGPPFMFFHYDLGPILPSAYISTSFSYPSGHSFRIIFIAYIWLVMTFEVTRSHDKRLLAIIGVVTLCVFMLFSRVALGEHWTSDVIGGSLLGLSLAIGSYVVSLQPRFRNLKTWPFVTART